MALHIFAKRVIGRSMHELTRNMGKTWRYMVSDSQYRWIGPEKSVTHLAVAGVLNAIWDLWGKILGKPVWKIVCDMTPEEIVRCIGFPIHHGCYYARGERFDRRRKTRRSTSRGNGKQSGPSLYHIPWMDGLFWRSNARGS